MVAYGLTYTFPLEEEEGEEGSGSTGPRAAPLAPSIDTLHAYRALPQPVARFLSDRRALKPGWAKAMPLMLRQMLAQRISTAVITRLEQVRPSTSTNTPPARVKQLLLSQQYLPRNVVLKEHYCGQQACPTSERAMQSEWALLQVAAQSLKCNPHTAMHSVPDANVVMLCWTGAACWGQQCRGPGPDPCQGSSRGSRGSRAHTLCTQGTAAAAATGKGWASRRQQGSWCSRQQGCPVAQGPQGLLAGHSQGASSCKAQSSNPGRQRQQARCTGPRAQASSSSRRQPGGRRCSCCRGCSR